MREYETMAKRAKRPVRRKKSKSGGSGAATLILVCALGAGLVIGLAGFESGAVARDAYDTRMAAE